MTQTYWTGVSGTLLGHKKDDYLSISYRRFLEDGFLPPEISKRGQATQVVHAGGIVSSALCDEDPELAWKVNVTGTRKLMEGLSRVGARRFLFVSTSHVYQQSDQPLSETSPVEPNSVYGETKLQGELTALKAGKELGLEVSVLRIFSLVGGQNSHKGLAGLLNRISQGERSKIRYCDDVRDFQTPAQYTRTLEAITRAKVLPEVINVASGLGLTVREVARDFFRHCDMDVPDSILLPGNSETPHIVASVARLKSITGLGQSPLDFKPSANLEQADNSEHRRVH